MIAQRAESRLDVFQAELELIGIELLGAGPETVGMNAVMRDCQDFRVWAGG